MLSLFFGALVGLALGLTGGGGSIFAVPLLIYGLGVAPRAAIATSLITVALTASSGVVEAGRRGVIEWRAGLIFAAAGVVAAPVGVGIGEYVAEGPTLVAFALLMLIVATRMIISAWREPDNTRVVRARVSTLAGNDRGTVCRYSGDGRLRLNARCSLALAITGLVVGVLSGFFGVGGGFLIVPALMLITEMGIHRAVATSLLVITLVGFSGVISTLAAGRSLDPAITGLFILGGISGMAAGRGLAGRLAGNTLQIGFALAMVGLAATMIIRRLLSG